MSAPTVNTMIFDHYIALGDSMSIDLYPSLDLGHDDELPIGAASLFHTNHDATWPEMAGKDLSARFPGIELTNLTSDGATTNTVLGSQLPTLRRRGVDGNTLVTLTVGGNDLLNALGGQEDLGDAALRVASNVDRCLDEIATLLPGALTLITTVYDPTDGTGNLPGIYATYGELPIEHLHTLNDRIRACGERDRVHVADAQRRFHGNGLSAPQSEWWYLADHPIEPNARGAHELRKLWLETLQAAGD